MRPLYCHEDLFKIASFDIVFLRTNGDLMVTFLFHHAVDFSFCTSDADACVF